MSFEILEFVFLDEVDFVLIECLEWLKVFGVLIEIDDFGSGYVFIIGFLFLCLDYIKLDRMFIKDIIIDDICRLVVEILI